MGFRQSCDNICRLSLHRHCVGKPNQTSGLCSDALILVQEAGGVHSPSLSVRSFSDICPQWRHQEINTRVDEKEKEREKQKVAHKYSCGGGGIICCRLSRNVAAHPPSRHLNMYLATLAVYYLVHIYIYTYTHACFHSKVAAQIYMYLIVCLNARRKWIKVPFTCSVIIEKKYRNETKQKTDSLLRSRRPQVPYVNNKRRR